MDEEKVDIVEVTSNAGEANAVTVSVTRDGAFTVTTVHDRGAPLTIAGGCEALDAQTARCRGKDDLGLLAIALGDGDDAATVASQPRGRFYYVTQIDGSVGNDNLNADDGGELKGGPGNDRLSGSPAYESLDGGSGNDRLFGGGSGDYLEGGPGDDVLRGGAGSDDLIGGAFDPGPEPAGADRMSGEAGDDSLDDGDIDSESRETGPDVADGGDGDDTIDSYRRRTGDVRVDLRAGAPAGEAGENDSLSGIETVIGGEGDDVLAGDGHRNWLDGRDGDDEAHGLGGNDLIFADGADRVTGDDGDDDIRTVPEFAGTLSCDRGRDSVRIDVFLSRPGNLAGPAIEDACERLSDGSSFAIDPVPALRSGGRLSFHVLKRRPRGLRLLLSRASAPFGTLGSAPIGSRRVIVRMPASLARRARHRAVTLRARVAPLGAAPFAWRFQVGGSAPRGG